MMMTGSTRTGDADLNALAFSFFFVIGSGEGSFRESDSGKVASDSVFFRSSPAVGGFAAGGGTAGIFDASSENADISFRISAEVETCASFSAPEARGAFPASACFPEPFSTYLPSWKPR